MLLTDFLENFIGVPGDSEVVGVERVVFMAQETGPAKIHIQIDPLAHLSPDAAKIVVPPGLAYDKEKCEFVTLCQKEMMEAGLTYPRSCPTCKLGPCVRKSQTGAT